MRLLGVAGLFFRPAARRLALSALAATLLVSGQAGRAAADVHPDTEGGVAVDRAIQAGDVDNINLFNGSLTVAIPLGLSYPVNGPLSYRFTLIYNSNPWTYANRSDNLGTYTYSTPSACSNAGLGWRVSFGALTPSACVSTDNTTLAPTAYEAPDGSEHLFYPTLHPGEPVDPAYLYTRDGTYLRLHRLSLGESEVEFPEGTIHKFAPGGLIEQMRDRYNNQVNFHYFADPASCSGALSCWQIQDSQNRTHWVYFRSEGIDRVDLAAFGGQRAIYTFNYVTATTGRSCQSNDPTVGDLAVSLLTSVVLPDSSSYAPGANGYLLAAAGAGHCTLGSGTLIGLTLPTLARISWGYQTYAFPASGRRSSNPGVATRTVTDAAGGRIGQWTYTTTPTAEPTGGVVELVNAVTDPAGNVTRRYFSIGLVNAYGPGSNLYDYARQYTPKTQLGTTGLYLAEQVFDSTGALRRTEWVRYERDQIDGAASQLPDASNNDGRVAERTTVYDDGAQAGYTDQDFDGLGHYRYRQTSGTFAGNNVHSERHHFNPARWTYAIDKNTNAPLATYRPVATTEPWVLGTEPFEWAQDNGGNAELRSLCYDPGTGSLLRRRIYLQSTKDPAAVSWGDLIEAFGYDGAGNLRTESYYGGDVSPVPPTSSDLCQQTLPASPEYQEAHDYLSGVLRRSQFSGTGFYSLDRDIDPSTGLVQTSRDTAGVPTSYTFDLLGRMTRSQPRDTAATVYTYTPAASPSALASVVVDRKTASAVPLARSQTLFDALGRPVEADTLMPDGRWSAQTTSYDALGRKTAVSEPGSPGRVTQYLNYDPFGRPGTIRPPDSTAANGFQHDVQRSYGGVQTVTRTTSVGNRRSGFAVLEAPTSTTETYDRFGRLASVAEPSGGGGGNVTTAYGYDSGGRLTTVTTTSGVTQTRTFTYDPRGFLLWENHPERGANSFGLGHGVDYAGYDSRGHAHRRIEGAHDLSFTFDSAERLRVLYTTGGAASCSPGSSSCVKELTYDATSPGKLYQASRFNHILLGGGSHVSKITYTYFYNGPDGRISQRDLQHTFDGVVDSTKEAFTQSFTYTPLGNVDTEAYPSCQSTFTLCGNTVSRGVQNVYTSGFLTAIPNYTGAAGLQYYPNGMVSQVAHVNGVTATYGNDPNGIERPSAITVTSPTSTVLWSSGGYSYDGAGNVTQIGHGSYLYDGVSRLTNAAVETNAVDAGSGNSLASQTTAYDAFGNIQAFSNRSTPTDSATNRLTGGSYASSGNLTFWNGATYDHDELNQLRHLTNGTQEWLYMYDADDERVWSFQPGAGATPRFDRWTLRGLDSKVKRDFEVSGYQWSNWASGNLWEDYIYRNGALLAAYLSTGPRRHMDLDHLGTVRLLTNSAGIPTGYHVFLPYGEEATAFNQDLERMKFTGHERDLADPNGAADDLDYMHAREFEPLTGRFLSLDSIGGEQRSPQSWNRYTYVENNPLKYVDPDGRQVADYYTVYGITVGASDASDFSRNAGDTLFLDGLSFSAILSSAGAYATPVGLGALAFGGGFGLGYAINKIPGVSEGIQAGIGVVIEPWFLSQNKNSRKVISGLLAAAKRDLGKMSAAGGPENDPAGNHHKVEIRAYLERAREIAKDLPGKSREVALKVIQEIADQAGVQLR